MMKISLYIISLTILLAGCNNPSPIKGAVLTELQINAAQKDSIVYADIDHERQHEFETLQIEDEEYHIDIYKYCLNDSSLTQKINIDNVTESKLSQATQVYHNYEVELIFGKVNGDPYTIFRKKINKEIFKDSLSTEFYEQATIFSVIYHEVRADRIYFDVVLSVPDSDWQEEFTCAIFFGTKKTSQLNYWKK